MLKFLRLGIPVGTLTISGLARSPCLGRALRALICSILIYHLAFAQKHPFVSSVEMRLSIGPDSLLSERRTLFAEVHPP